MLLVAGGNIAFPCTSIGAVKQTFCVHHTSIQFTSFTRRDTKVTIMNASSINPSAFSALNERLLSAGKVRHSDLDSIGKPSIGKGKMLSVAKTCLDSILMVTFYKQAMLLSKPKSGLHCMILQS